jgi:hypothetical protein
MQPWWLQPIVPGLARVTLFFGALVLTVIASTPNPAATAPLARTLLTPE